MRVAVLILICVLFAGCIGSENSPNWEAFDGISTANQSAMAWDNEPRLSSIAGNGKTWHYTYYHSMQPHHQFRVTMDATNHVLSSSNETQHSTVDMYFGEPLPSPFDQGAFNGLHVAKEAEVFSMAAFDLLEGATDAYLTCCIVEDGGASPAWILWNETASRSFSARTGEEGELVPSSLAHGGMEEFSGTGGSFVLHPPYEAYAEFRALMTLSWDFPGTFNLTHPHIDGSSPSHPYLQFAMEGVNGQESFDFSYPILHSNQEKGGPLTVEYGYGTDAIGGVNMEVLWCAKVWVPSFNEQGNMACQG